MLACSFKAAAAAYPRSKWPRKVRAKRDGAVLEPTVDSFDVTVAPGEGVQAAVDRCPPGGCVLLLPGVHAGPLVLGPREVVNGEGPPVQVADKEVHVFGRGRATLRAAAGDVLTSAALVSTIDGLAVRRDAGEGRNCCGVQVKSGRLRLQDCKVAGVRDSSVVVSGGDPMFESCKCVAGADVLCAALS